MLAYAGCCKNCRRCGVEQRSLAACVRLVVRSWKRGDTSSRRPARVAGFCGRGLGAARRAGPASGRLRKGRATLRLHLLAFSPCQPGYPSTSQNGQILRLRVARFKNRWLGLAIRAARKSARSALRLTARLLDYFVREKSERNFHKEIALSMKLHSWNRFTITSFRVGPDLLGRTVSFVHQGSTVTIRLPPKERVTESYDESALATRRSWQDNTGELISADVYAVDVLTECEPDVNLPAGVLDKRPNAYDLIDEPTQTTLNSIAAGGSSIAISAFEYWVTLLRWATSRHAIGRELRIGSQSGWSTYLRDRASGKDVWVDAMTIQVMIEEPITLEQWQTAERYAKEARVPPIHTVLLAEAAHCIDVADYRRCIIDLATSCEVFLRSTVVRSLPHGITEAASTYIEEANINQYVSHLFPALLNDQERATYSGGIKNQLSALFAKRNKILHMAAHDGVSREICHAYLATLSRLFRLSIDTQS